MHPAAFEKAGETFLLWTFTDSGKSYKKTIEFCSKLCYNINVDIRRCGEIGRRKGLKIPR